MKKNLHSFKLCEERPDLCIPWGCKCKCHKGGNIKLTNLEKQELAEETMKKLLAICKVNGFSLESLDPRMRLTLIMTYQQGLKDAKDLLRGV